jgi:uncharacterized protein YqeY
LQSFKRRKKCKWTDAVEAYTKANAIKKTQREEQELLILKEFLPEEMSTDKIEQIVDEVIAGGETDFGKVMRAVMAKTQGSADGSVVSQIVRTKLQK